MAIEYFQNNANPQPQNEYELYDDQGEQIDERALGNVPKFRTVLRALELMMAKEIKNKDIPINNGQRKAVIYLGKRNYFSKYMEEYTRTY